LLRTIIIKRLSLVAFFTATSATAATHEYVVTVAEDLRQIQIVARFGTAVKDVSARSRSAGDFLISAHDCDRDIALPVAPRLVAPNDGLRCLAYRVDLEKAARLNRRYDQSDANTLIVQIPLWMWRPRLGGTDEVIVSFELPDDVNVSVPGVTRNSSRGRSSMMDSYAAVSRPPNCRPTKRLMARSATRE
jgi:hypothetical protein